jgi:hypothetical protein
LGLEYKRRRAVHRRGTRGPATREVWIDGHGLIKRVVLRSANETEAAALELRCPCGCSAPKGMTMVLPKIFSATPERVVVIAA